MLTAMGREIAACHAGDRAAVAGHLARLPSGWLRGHAKAAARRVEDDWRDFRG